MKRYAVIGNPIKHSLSPAMHNAAFKELGVDAHYEALRVDRLDRVWGRLRKTYAGINVTIPHKITVLDFIDEREMAVDLIGAVNCISFDKTAGGHKTAKGYNTDMYGAVEALKIGIPKLKGKRVLVLGAGGAARAIVFGCTLEGAEVCIQNRTVEKAKELAGDVKEKLGAKVSVADAVDERVLEGFDVLVNATSVGMSKPDESPLNGNAHIPKRMVVMDIVYNPLETKLLRQAKAAGARTIDGLEMFVRQGAESLRIWGYDPPLEVMRKVALQSLKSRRWGV